MEISKINSERKANSETGRDGFAARGRPRRCESALQNPQGALRAPPGAKGGAWGCGFGCAFASPWPAACCEYMNCFRSWFCGWS